MAADGLQVDRTQSNAMNLQVLKRQDRDVQEIVDTASHVVMYEFDQTAQSWKRKDVEGCLFVVKRSSAPRFQIHVNNRLSTTNMTLALDERLEVDNVDSFLILRSPDTTYPTGYAIYGIWFFPEEDRAKLLGLLQRLIQSLKAPQSAAAGPAPTQPVEEQSPVQTQTQLQTKPKQQQVAQPSQQEQVTQPSQHQEKQPRSRGRRNKRDDSKRRGSNPTNTPTMILQRSPKGKANGSSNGSSSGESANGVVKQEAANTSSGMVPISKADGIAAGEAILSMISQNRPQQQQKQKQQTSSNVSKEQLKQTLIGLLDDAQFFDQIYHAYVNRVSKQA
ncbi:mRNA-decapping enzyme 1B [Phytophthora boehmeriae]|uniref:mRNA-decapping enzyme 1B n=1 Tax=Phytophthora boehmeriae TaxID=109152 RepID=A0A8T1XCH7_9STRA|nr:mRNA-decapping enzyme 1B [Phytophthora boehmeriae]